MEERFSTGMLSKMSKITDLISKLDGLDGISPEDKQRSKKSETQILFLIKYVLWFQQTLAVVI